MRDIRVKTRATARAPWTLTADRTKATGGAAAQEHQGMPTAAQEITGTSGDANSRNATIDGNTIKRRDLNNSRYTSNTRDANSSSRYVNNIRDPEMLEKPVADKT
jgi:hypothetical protein